MAISVTLQEMNTPNGATMGNGENMLEHGSNPCRTATSSNEIKVAAGLWTEHALRQDLHPEEAL
jgi:hypothetical protein